MPKYSLKIGSEKLTLAKTENAISEEVGRRLGTGQPDTLVDSGGTTAGYDFDSQELSTNELRELKEICARDAGTKRG